jgi:hypothetical protein
MQASVLAAIEAERAREANRLKRERANLERQSRTLAKLPTRKDRADIEALEAIVEQSKQNAKAKDARHKLTVERLRRQIVTLQVCFPKAPNIASQRTVGRQAPHIDMLALNILYAFVAYLKK